MKPLWKDMLTAIFMGMILPGILLNAAAVLLDSKDSAPGHLVFNRSVSLKDSYKPTK